MLDKIEPLIRRLTLQNAIQYGGKARAAPIIRRFFAEKLDLKIMINDLTLLVDAIVKETNNLSFSSQKKLMAEKWPKFLVRKKTQLKSKSLSPLPNVNKYLVIHVRFCPNPDGALHIGGARAAILDDEYRKMYGGRMTLRFDDTDPRIKSPILEAYSWIREDLKWLGVKWHDEVYQSDRLELYYFYVVKLLEMGASYVCVCKAKEFRQRILLKEPCPCRDLSVQDNLKRWESMLNGTYEAGDAVVRIKTELNHPNPAVRDWPALRIIDVSKYPHPITGCKYWVWPLFAFCSGIDDHVLQVTHILRGKEHLTNSVRQRFLYDYLGWEYPEAIHYGRLKLVGTVLSKSKIREGIEKGEFSGWNDPRLGTLKALRRRGYLPKTIRQFILSIGPKPVDVTISWKNLDSINRKLLDPEANRYFFVANPIDLVVRGLKKTHFSRLPLHPDYPDRGFRTLNIVPSEGEASFHISKDDLELLKPNKVVRLMGLFNIKIKKVRQGIEANYYSCSHLEAKKLNAPLIHWIPAGTGLQTMIIMPDASTVSGLSEKLLQSICKNSIVQFERVGFVRIDNIEDMVIAYYAHR